MEAHEYYKKETGKLYYKEAALELELTDDYINWLEQNVVKLFAIPAVIKSVCDECTAYPFDERGKTPLCKTCKDNPSQDDYVLWLEQQLHIQGLCLAKKVIEILDKKCRKGCTDPTWVGFQNGNGSECGIDIERLIKQAKRFKDVRSSDDTITLTKDELETFLQDLEQGYGSWSDTSRMVVRFLGMDETDGL